MFNKLREKYATKRSAKAEALRLQKVFPEFEKRYAELCRELKVQWVPIIIPSKNKQNFGVRLQLQTLREPELTPEQMEALQKAVDKKIDDELKAVPEQG